MQGENNQNRVILLFSFELPSEARPIEEIIKAFQGIAEVKHSEIEIRTKDDKHDAKLILPAEKAKFFETCKEIFIGGVLVPLRRYYYDYQIFIKKLPIGLSEQFLHNHFSQFGEVTGVAITRPVPKKQLSDKNFYHAFIKFKDSATVAKIFLRKNIMKGMMGEEEVRLDRTFNITESEAKDFALELKINRAIQEADAFEVACNQYFQTFGQIRERIHLQNSQRQRVHITYTKEQAAQKAFKEFDKKSLGNGAFLQYDFELKHVVASKNTPKEATKLFAIGIKFQLTEDNIRKPFEKYGKVISVELASTKTNVVTATITYENSNQAKKLLISYLEDSEISSIFVGKPSITFFMSHSERKAFMNYIVKNKPKEQNQTHFQGNMPSMSMSPMGIYQMNMNQMGMPPMGIYQMNMNQMGMNQMGMGMNQMNMGMNQMGMGMNQMMMGMGGMSIGHQGNTQSLGMSLNETRHAP